MGVVSAWLSDKPLYMEFEEQVLHEKVHKPMAFIKGLFGVYGGNY